MNRKKFIKLSALSAASFPLFLSASKSELDEKSQLDLKLIEEFVIAGHNDLPKVKEMLRSEPQLLYARHDWDNGDLEEAIEGAAHVGNKEIVNYLIEQGARINLFSLVIIGKTEIVSSILDLYPSLINTKGPHGFTLLHHTRILGNEGKSFEEYLIKKGLNQSKIPIN
ncbi:MAG: hypothetical protein CMP59_09975 [Flavobacteriales bacterium]|nr:hypothetical protein [Flavobacteriales bacterium]|tara:strand:- start:890 stop:1393 length:504 start_codon:yes stop_codon:yes gene_type:complete